MTRKIRFTEIERKLKHGQPGLYKIYTLSGVPLKVGISKDLRDRLRKHRDSRQKSLKLKLGGNRSQPTDVLSKQSILAKHLYYDEVITTNFDLKSEIGRREFLKSCCEIEVKFTNAKEDARLLENKLEATGSFRYVGPVKIFLR